MDTPDTEQQFRLAQMAGQPRRRTALIAFAAGGTVVLIAATVAITLALSGHPAAQPAAQPQTAASSATTAVASTPAATTAAATPPTPGMLKLGAKADADFVSAIAYAYKQPVAAKAPKPDQDGFEWGAADVEICAKGAGTLDNSSWVLIYADHSRIEASSIGYQQFPAPKYPWGQVDMVPGQCVRGWITYPVPAGKRPTSVHYQPRGFQADWAVA